MRSSAAACGLPLEFAGLVWVMVWVLGPTKGLREKVQCGSLSTIHINYNPGPVQALSSLPGRCTRLLMFHCTEVVEWV